MKQLREWKNQFVTSSLPTVLISLIILGAILGVSYYLGRELIPTPKIGIIEIQTQLGSFTAERMSREIDYALNARDIAGVVLVIDSPGGAASAGYDIYYQVRRLREEMPVVASIDGLAASGGYQVSVAANEIYAKPASIIGNVGVIFSQPRPERLSERTITSGPFKSTGGNATDYLQKLELLAADFRDSVIAERSNAPNPLKLSPDELATGEIWLGLEAKAYGLIDELGSGLDAIDAVARLAGLEHYQVVSVRDEYLASLAEDELETALSLYEEATGEAEFDLTGQETEWPAYYQLYLPLE